jgi:streptothricin acetyltransferase
MTPTPSDDHRYSIRHESAASLAEYATVPARYETSSVFDVEDAGGVISLRVRALPTPFVKNYDAIPDNSPAGWPSRFTVGGWGFFSARTGASWAGGIAVSGDVALLPAGEWTGASVVWDLRVAPAHRGRGVGTMLFAAAEGWARQRGSTRLLAETQNVNVAACRFYERQGCAPRDVERGAYPEFPGEVLILFEKSLATGRACTPGISP